MQLFSHDLGIDLGTANVLIYVDGKGVVVREPAVVAVDKNNGKILQVGSAARNMLGRTPGNVVAMHPLKDGVISDHEMTVKMLQVLFREATKTALFNPKPRVVICVPSGVTEVEERTVINAAIDAGARRVYLIEEPLAAALGAGIDIKSPNGQMVVDIGCGTTDIAVLTLNGVASSASVAQIEGAFHLALCAAGKSLELLNITGMNSKLGGLYNAETGYYELSKKDIFRDTEIGAAGYAALIELEAKELTLKVKLFGEIPECLWGDANHDNVVNSDDASLVEEYVVNGGEMNVEFCTIRTDVNGDGVINTDDASLIREYVVGNIDVFPAEANQ